MPKLRWIIIAVLLTVIIILIIALSSKKTSQNIQQPVIYASPSPVSSNFPSSYKELQVISLPNSDTLNNLSPGAVITITFNDLVDKNTLKYTIDPQIKTLVDIDQTGKQLFFQPTDYWKPNVVYIIKITDLKGQNNSILKKELRIQFKAVVSYYEQSTDITPERSNPQQ